MMDFIEFLMSLRFTDVLMGLLILVFLLDVAFFIMNERRTLQRDDNDDDRMDG